MNTNNPEEFDEFLRRRESASNDYIRGSAQKLSAMLTHQDPATFMPPGGAVIEGAIEAENAQLAGASGFGPDSDGHFEVLNSGSSGDLAFWTGRQIASVGVKGQDQPVRMILRVSEVFRREDGQWKLVHRHADIPTMAKD